MLSFVQCMKLLGGGAPLSGPEHDRQDGWWVFSCFMIVIYRAGKLILAQ